MKKLGFVFLAMLFTSCISTLKYTDDQLNQFLLDAKAADVMINVSARKYADIYFNLAEAYFERDMMDEALAAVKKGLRLDSARLHYQLLAAEIEFELELYTAVDARILKIRQFAIDEKILRRAEQIQRRLKGKDYQPSETYIPPHFEKYIYILRVGDVDDIYLSVIKNKLQDEYKLTVKILDETIIPSTDNFRDNHQRYFVESVNKYIEQAGKEAYGQLVEFLVRTGIISQGDNVEERVMYFFYLQEQNGEELWVKNMSLIADQYDADKIMNQVRMGFQHRLNEAHCLGILAVTSYDIYANDYNFLFGWNSHDVAVMSYSRFIGPDVDTSTEIKRIDMQALSSAGYVIGIPRCTVPYCARAYPQSLIEHDAKEDVLCEECRANVLAVYNRF